MGLMTVDELREFVTTSLSDDALSEVLVANEDAIVDAVGPLGPTTIIRFPSIQESVILLGVEPHIISIVEYFDTTEARTLAVDDYWVLEGAIRRRGDGTNPMDHWGSPLQIVFSARDDFLSRRRVLRELCKLDATSKPGLKRFRVGAHEEEFSEAEGQTYETKRQGLIESLNRPGIPLFA